MTLLYYIGLPLFTLIFGVIFYLKYRRNYFNKYKYIRLVRYNDNMTIDVLYIKKENFNQDNAILINPKHIYNFKGYQSVIITSNSVESINPIDFESKYDPKDFQSAMRSKLIAETFASLKVDKFDKVMMLLLLSAVQLIAIAYLLYMVMGNGGSPQ